MIWVPGGGTGGWALQAQDQPHILSLTQALLPRHRLAPCDQEDRSAGGMGLGRLLRPLAGLREALEGGVDGGSVAAGVSNPDAHPPPLLFPLEE